MSVSEAQKEQIKLRAGYLNGLATGLFSSGVIAPSIATVLNPDAARWTAAIGTLVTLSSLAFSYYVHIRAQETLTELEQ